MWPRWPYMAVYWIAAAAVSGAGNEEVLMDSANAPDGSTERRALAVLVALGAALLVLCPVMLYCVVIGDDCEDFGWLGLAQGAVYALAVWLVLRHAWRARAAA